MTRAYPPPKVFNLKKMWIEYVVLRKPELVYSNPSLALKEKTFEFDEQVPDVVVMASLIKLPEVAPQARFSFRAGAPDKPLRVPEKVYSCN
jgi:hypothetical protein